jgi:hypothetical protein
MLIKKLLDCLDGHWVKVGIFGNSELAFYVGEREIPISVFLHRNGSHSIVLDVEGYSWSLRTEEVIELGVVMSLLSEEESITEIRGWVEDIE